MKVLEYVKKHLEHDGIEVTCLSRSICKETGAEVSTHFVRMPRIILPEVNTHRIFSRNVASSRAIPVLKMLANLKDKYFKPLFWGSNKAGMASTEELGFWATLRCELWWWFGMKTASMTTRGLTKAGLHKQWANRPVEPYLYVTAVITSTEWDNFYELRIDEAAQPEIISLSLKMKCAAQDKAPRIVSNSDPLDASNWHYAYITDQERHQNREQPEYLAKLDAARCARTSYLTQEGLVPNPEKELATYEKLVGSRPIHASPTEHQCYPLVDRNEKSGNLTGFHQFRKTVEKQVWTS